MNMNEKNLTRDEYVYIAKLHERAERFDEIVKSINNFVKLDPVLSNEERDILSAGFKNVISSKRSS
jgi:14-3-3 protein epsilon